MEKFLKKAKENSYLYYSLLLMIPLSLAFLIALFIDTRTVLGVNTWIKPLKFSLSFIPFLITFIYILQNHPEEERKTYSKKIAITTWIEMILISLQAARAIPSHFNQTTLLDGAIFTIMGIAIAYTTFVIAKLTLSFFKKSISNFSKVEVKSIQLGLILFLLGCFEGGYMSSQTSHAVGATSNSQALPFLNWSTIFGDLRVTHFIGIHAIQILLVIALIYHAIVKSEKLEKLFLSILNLTFLLITSLMTYSFILTLQGRSVFNF